MVEAHTSPLDELSLYDILQGILYFKPGCLCFREETLERSLERASMKYERLQELLTSRSLDGGLKTNTFRSMLSFMMMGDLTRSSGDYQTVALTPLGRAAIGSLLASYGTDLVSAVKDLAANVWQ